MAVRITVVVVVLWVDMMILHYCLPPSSYSYMIYMRSWCCAWSCATSINSPRAGRSLTYRLQWCRCCASLSSSSEDLVFSTAKYARRSIRNRNGGAVVLFPTQQGVRGDMTLSRLYSSHGVVVVDHRSIIDTITRCMQTIGGATLMHWYS
jgi:hypothetical protein